MTVPHLELIYPNFPFWRAEVSRLALHLGGVPFVDRRPTRSDVAALKSEGVLPFGQLPVLLIDGQPLGQTAAIARYCGKLAGLYPSAALAAARVDEVIDVATDITTQIGPSMREPDPQTRADLRARLGTQTLPRWLGYLENRLEANGATGFFVGDSLTIADLAIWRLVGWLTSGILDGIPTTLLQGLPQLTAHYARIDSEPRVRAWMDSHYG